MKKINVFYADDDEDDVIFFNEAIKEITNNREYEINLHVHFNGENLIDNLKKNKDVDGVVFLDINMPIKSGLEILENIRQEDEINTFPVIMCSTSSNMDMVSKSQHLGANFYFVKPYQFDKLKNVISRFIQMNWKDHQPKKNDFLYKG